jgi:ABC-2 type transport system ATP-binding protein
LITVKELTKRYGAHTAVDALSFTVDKGQIYGLLGPNGAGKSTTMNIITGYISATDGTAEIDGCDIFDRPAEARAKIGYLPEQPPLYTDMTPREYLAFAAELKGCRGSSARRRWSSAWSAPILQTWPTGSSATFPRATARRGACLRAAGRPARHHSG